MFPKLPKEALQVIGAVDAAGGRGYLVGGALRDLMRGALPEDWDFAATLPPEKLLRIFAGSRLTGGACGTVSAPMAGGRCEITPCRSEGDYGDGRHPGRVDFVPDILADLSRRDFTVNAMACDGRVLFDPFGGQRDLQKRVLRCVGDARARFAEDALRVLRLYRLAAQLGFTAEWNTFCAAGDAIEGLAALPGERVAGEVRRTLMSDGPQVLGGLIARGGLRSFGFAFAPALHALAGTPRVFLCRLWALAALCGADAARAGAAFGLARKTAAALAEYTRLYRMGPAAGSTALKMKLSQTRLDYAPVAATFAAVSPAFAAEPALYAAVRANKEPYRICHLAVDGGMLYREGIRGEQCGQVLNELLLAVIKYPSLNKPPVLLGLARGLKKLL